MELMHYGTKGQKWGVRRYQNPDGTRTELGKKRERTVFVSGSSKTQFKDSGYYRKKLPRKIRKELKGHAKAGHRIIVGDAPGIDRQVQDYLNKKKHQNVEVYSPGMKNRYLANKSWKVNYINDKRTKEGSPAWLAAKDKAMTKAADEGLAVILDKGSKATKNNIKRLVDQMKDVKVYQLSSKGKRKDRWR